MPNPATDINAQLQSYFDKVLVLTVRRFKERQEKVQQRLQGISFEFFYGADKQELNDAFIHANYKYDKTKSLSIRQYFKEMNGGEIACALSHRMIYQAMIDHNWQRVLVLEDDVIPDWDNLPQLQHCLQELPPDWELFYLGYLKNEKITFGAQLKNQWYKILGRLGFSKMPNSMIGHILPKNYSTSLMKAGFHDCTHAYAVSLSGAKKLVAAQTPVEYRADNLLTALVLKEQLNAFASKHFLFNQEIFNNSADQSYVREPQKLSVS